MGVVFFIGFLFEVLIFGGIIFLFYFRTQNQKARYVLRIIMMLAIGLPISWIIFMFYINFILVKDIKMPQLNLFLIYFGSINILGILGYGIYKIILHLLKKKDDKPIINFLNFLLYLNILFDFFPILAILFNK